MKSIWKEKEGQNWREFGLKHQSVIIKQFDFYLLKVSECRCIAVKRISQLFPSTLATSWVFWETSLSKANGSWWFRAKVMGAALLKKFSGTRGGKTRNQSAVQPVLRSFDWSTFIYSVSLKNSLDFIKLFFLFVLQCCCTFCMSLCAKPGLCYQQKKSVLCFCVQVTALSFTPLINNLSSLSSCTYSVPHTQVQSTVVLILSTSANGGCRLRGFFFFF